MASRDRGVVSCRHCEERPVRRSSKSEGGSDEAIHSFFARRNGLLRGACHRARVRATRWLAMTAGDMDCFAESVTGRVRATRRLAMTIIGCLKFECIAARGARTPPTPTVITREGG